MVSIQTRAHIGADGKLAVEVPTDLHETDVEVMLVVQPVPNGHRSPEQESTPESRGWPPGFFEETYGSLRDDPLERLPQGEYEQREPIK